MYHGLTGNYPPGRITRDGVEVPSPSSVRLVGIPDKGRGTGVFDSFLRMARDSGTEREADLALFLEMTTTHVQVDYFPSRAGPSGLTSPTLRRAKQSLLQPPALE